MKLNETGFNSVAHSIELSKEPGRLVKKSIRAKSFYNMFYIAILDLKGTDSFFIKEIKEQLDRNKELQAEYRHTFGVRWNFTDFTDRYPCTFARLYNAGYAKVWKEKGFVKCQLIPMENLPENIQLDVSVSLF